MKSKYRPQTFQPFFIKKARANRSAHKMKEVYAEVIIRPPFSSSKLPKAL